MGGKGAGAYGARTALKEDVHDEAGEISRGAASRRSTGTRNERGVLGGGRFTIRCVPRVLWRICAARKASICGRDTFTPRARLTFP